jgi:fructose-bisphosphate aldolase class II
MNIDTDLQFAFTEGVRDYMVKKLSPPPPYGADPPNPYDPRNGWSLQG